MKNYQEKNKTALLPKRELKNFTESHDYENNGRFSGTRTMIQADPDFKMRDSRLVLFTGVKGGCGCSFVANSVASYLAGIKNKNIVLFDGNVCRQDSRMIYNISGSLLRDFGDASGELEEMNVSMLKKVVINFENSLNVILPPLKFEKAIYDLSEGFLNFIDLLLEFYDMVIADLPQYYFFGNNVKFISLADKIAVVSGADRYSKLNLDVMMENLYCLELESKTDILINKFNLKTAMAPAVLLNSKGHPVKMFISYDRDIEYFYNSRGPFGMFNYSLRTVKALTDYSENLYDELF